jgi:hypothetical protein
MSYIDRARKIDDFVQHSAFWNNGQHNSTNGNMVPDTGNVVPDLHHESFWPGIYREAAPLCFLSIAS